MEKYTVSQDYLDKLIEQSSKCLVGKILKRHEIVNDSDTLKKDIKELIYEHFRDLKTFISAFNCGVKFIESEDKK
jgi:hypothetical protein